MSPWQMKLMQGTMLYAALVLHVTDVAAAGPQWVLVVLCWWLGWGRQTSRYRVLWAMLCGLCLDLAGHQQLGLHLAICGGLAAALSLSCAPSVFRNAWALPAIAVGCGVGQQFLSDNLASLIAAKETIPPGTMLIAAVYRGLMTGGVVLALVLLQVMARRLLRSERSHNVFTLQNQWTRLSEG